MKKYKFKFSSLGGLREARNITDNLLNEADHVLTCKVETNICHLFYSKLLSNYDYLTIDQLKEIVFLGEIKTSSNNLKESNFFDIINYNIHIEFTEEEAMYLSMKYGNIYNFSKAFIYE